MKSILRSVVYSLVSVLPFKRQVFSALRLLNPPKCVHNLLRFRGRFKVPVSNRLSFYMNHYGYGVENGIFWRGLFRGSPEDQALRLWIKLCGDADTIFDVGANMGIYSLVAKTVKPQAKVHAFEPVEHIHGKLVRNCEINHYEITCEHAALANTNGSADLFIVPGEKGLMTASLGANQRRTETERVRTIALANYIESRGIGHVDLMKIDVEGYEAQVLEGMGKHLVGMKPAIILEVLDDEAGEKVDAVVKQCRFLCFNIDEARGPVRVQKLTVKGRSRHSRNFLLCNEGTAERLCLT